jgi:hypothetical protein
MNGQKKTSPWVYVGIGCTVILVLGVAGVGTLGYMGYRWGKQLEQDMKDPVAREEKVKKTLGAAMLPEGYHPVASVSIPFLMDMAILSDRPPGTDGQPRGMGERGFMYFQLLSPGSDERELRDYFEGKTDDDAVLRRNNMKLRVRNREVIRRGALDMKGYKLMYVAQRGEVEMSDAHTEGVSSFILVDCPQDTRMRMAMWFTPDPDPGTPVKSANFAGTPADEAALNAFMGHFTLCPAP